MKRQFKLHASLSLALASSLLAPLGQAQQPNPYNPPPQASGYTLVFDDEFTTPDLSPNGLGVYTWYQGVWFDHKRALVSNFKEGNGALQLTWTADQSSPDTSVTTLSPDKQTYKTFRYGYFEANMKWDVVTGAWPAFWMIPIQDATGQDNYNGVKESGELDIFEGYAPKPHTFYGTIHDWVNNVDHSNAPNYYNLPADNDFSQFHTYGVLWVPGSVTWYYDNKPLHTVPTPAIFDVQDYFLVLSMQEGVLWQEGNRAGVTATSMSTTVNWVRAWQKK